MQSVLEEKAQSDRVDAPKINFIVALDRPHYPEVHPFEDYNSAREKYEELIEYNRSDDGKYKGTVVLTKLVTITHIRTDY